MIVARELVNEPPNVLYPVEFARRASQLKKFGVDVEVLDVKAMKKLGMRRCHRSRRQTQPIYRSDQGFYRSDQDFGRSMRSRRRNSSISRCKCGDGADSGRISCCRRSPIASQIAWQVL